MSEILPTDTAYKAVDFIETYCGRAFFPLMPRAADVAIVDIAHALAHQCRYSGHTEFFYSTAQHCCLLADFVERRMDGSPLDCLQILLHDCGEAYLVDVPRPVKQFMPEFRRWDYAITMCVRSWAGLADVPIPPWQDDIDSRIIHDERAQVMSASGLDWKQRGEPLGVVIAPWSDRMAEQQFLMRYADYAYKVFGKHQYLRSRWGISTNSKFHEIPFRTMSADRPQYGVQDERIITDLIEVDLRGGCGRVAVRSPDGMMARDTRAGSFPRPAWKWIHGTFELDTPNIDKLTINFEDAKQ